MSDTQTRQPDLGPLHEKADAMVVPYSYKKPGEIEGAGKGRVYVCKTEALRGVVQIVKKNGGENNLHYHTNSDSFWMVLKGRVRFYGPDNKLVGEFGPQEGTVTPRYSRYWFENAGEDDAELLQIAALHKTGMSENGGRVDLEPQRFKVGSAPRFSAMKK